MDPRPNTEDIPPQINIATEETYLHPITGNRKLSDVTVFDDEGLRSVMVSHSGETRGVKQIPPKDVERWENETGLAGEKSTSVSPPYVYDEEELTVIATDVNWNQHTLTVDTSSIDDEGLTLKEGATTITAGAPLVGGTTSVGAVAGGTVSGPAIGGAVVVAGAIGAAARAVEMQFSDGSRTNEYEAPVHMTPTVETYRTHSRYGRLVDYEVTSAVGYEHFPLRLPSGFSEEISDPAGGSLHRGYGWEYIDVTLPSITPDEIATILSFPNAVREVDGGTLVIGDNPNGPGEVVLRISEGMIVSASQTVTDPRGKEVVINEGHGTRKEATLEEVKEIIKSPEEIYKPANEPGSQLHYYVGQLEDGTWTIIKVFMGGEYSTGPNAPDYNRFSTETGPNSNNIEDVRQWLENRIPEDLIKTYST
jgi:hypothetical protein